MSELHPGAVIDGRYTIVGPLASGGMGAVYRAEHRKLKRPVAIKILRGDAQPGWAERFCREARAACTLRHPNVVTTFDFGTDPQTQHAYLALELINGRSLSEALREGELDVGRACHVLTQVSAALAEAHRLGVVHRDIKPANIMLSRVADDPDFATVIDFGIARVLEGPDDLTRTLTAAGELIGTPAYMAPEVFQVRGGPPSDVYAVAILAYRLLSGRRPFVASKLADLIFQVRVKPAPPMGPRADEEIIADDLAQLVMSGLQKDPAARPTMSEFRRGFARFAQPHVLADAPLVPPSPPPQLLETIDSRTDPLEATAAAKRAPEATLASQDISQETATPAITVDHGRGPEPEAPPAPDVQSPGERAPTLRNWRWGLLLVGLALAFVVASSTEIGAMFSGESQAISTLADPIALSPVTPIRQAESEWGLSRRPPAPPRFQRALETAQRLNRRSLATTPRPIALTNRRRRQPIDSTVSRRADRSPRPVLVRLIADPFGRIEHRGKTLGHDVVNSRIAPGRRCFGVTRGGRTATRCVQIGAAATTVRLRAP